MQQRCVVLRIFEVIQQIFSEVKDRPSIFPITRLEIRIVAKCRYACRVDIMFVWKELHGPEVFDVAVFRPLFNATSTEPMDKVNVRTRVTFWPVYDVQTQPVLVSAGAVPVL
jgi:hypothetical protein